MPCNVYFLIHWFPCLLLTDYILICITSDTENKCVPLLSVLKKYKCVFHKLYSSKYKILEWYHNLSLSPACVLSVAIVQTVTIYRHKRCGFLVLCHMTADSRGLMDTATRLCAAYCTEYHPAKWGQCLFHMECLLKVSPCLRSPSVCR